MTMLLVRPDSGRDRGQSTVEFALIIPLIAIVLLLAVQIAVLGAAKVASVHMARDVARVVAIDPAFDPEVGPLDLARDSDRSNDLSLKVEILPASRVGQLQICVSVRDETPPIFAAFAPFLSDVVLVSEAKMLIEN